ncbi:hypothetical protein ABB07_00730 [Streptomyces incarnatus]|uniref:Uncharacterized protein n=1 Tax=Streptomyces incarnatus TaxID=665007 RepID=A0ABM5TCE5_9ACTN|nr:hypothetical protein ABB07_00730 [Streptomyces incarnatus]
MQVLARVVGECVADLVEAQPELGQSADAGQLDGVAQAVRAVAVGLPSGFGQQADAVVVPHGAGGDAGDRGEFSDTHALSRNVVAATRSSMGSGLGRAPKRVRGARRGPAGGYGRDEP